MTETELKLIVSQAMELPFSSMPSVVELNANLMDAADWNTQYKQIVVSFLRIRVMLYAHINSTLSSFV